MGKALLTPTSAKPLPRQPPPAKKSPIGSRRTARRLEETYPHYRYAFEEVSREPVTEDALGGLVLEEPTSQDSSVHGLALQTPLALNLDQFQPEVV